MAYRTYIKYIIPIMERPIQFIVRVLSFFGGYYTFCEIEYALFKSNYLLDFFRNHLLLFVIVVIVITIFVFRDKTDFKEYIANKDITISLKLDNILKQKKTAIIIPTNTTFDTIMSDDFISINSIQGQFQQKYFDNNLESLNALIEKSLDEYYPNKYSILNDRKNSKSKKYDIGTVARLNIKNQHYYFLAVSDVNKYGKPQNATMENMTRALVSLWQYLSDNGFSEPISIPVIGTGRAGLQDGTFEDIIHETIFSFIVAAKERFVAKELVITIFPNTLKKANVSWNNLCEYLKLEAYYCKDNEYSKNSIVHSEPIEN